MKIVFSVTLGTCWLFLIAPSIRAEQLTPYSSGTGFYVSRQGHVVTSAHVLDACKDITLQSDGDKPVPANVLTSDTALDLALLQGKEWPDRVAYLRHDNMEVPNGEDVMLIGYPETEGFPGHYSVAYSRVTSSGGLTGDARWLRFEDAAQSGNSGGPLLDKAGNVVGVITGKMEIYRHNDINARDEVVERSDVAVSLPLLKSFLQEHRIPFEIRDSLMRVSDSQLESRGSEFIVHVVCRQ